jgi:decaprenyl-phosphate phosphoribosyltransferase
MNYIRLMRPFDWVKNVFVLLPIVFWLGAEGLGGGNFAAILWPTSLALLGFCLLASCVYCFNDAVDANKDRLHPIKKLRPVASGAITPIAAMVFGAFLGLCAFLLASLVSFNLVGIFGLYALLQLCYNLGLKYVLLVDVVAVALGFVLRSIAGAYAIDIKLSIWLLLCVFFLCLYLGFIKRLCDLSSSGKDGETSWKSRAGYDSSLELNLLLGLSFVLSIMMYVTYALSAHAQEIFGARAMGFALLTPLVLVVMHRFYRNASEGRSDSPLSAILRDPIIQLGSLLFGIGVLICLYMPGVERVLGNLLVN